MFCCILVLYKGCCKCFRCRCRVSYYGQSLGSPTALWCYFR